MYLENFRLPGMETEEMLLARRMEHNGGRNLGYIDNPYPCGLFPAMDLRELNFERITILYGGNGSGKSTLLNLITQKLGLKRSAPFNSGEMMESFVNACSYETGYDDYGERMKIPEGSRIITSDDIFEYMLAARSGNEEIENAKEEAKGDWAVLKYGKGLRFHGMDDYEDLRFQNLARSRSVSRRKFLKKTLGEEVRLVFSKEAGKRHPLLSGRAGKFHVSPNAAGAEKAFGYPGPLLRLPADHCHPLSLPAVHAGSQDLQSRRIPGGYKELVGTG